MHHAAVCQVNAFTVSLHGRPKKKGDALAAVAGDQGRRADLGATARRHVPHVSPAAAGHVRMSSETFLTFLWHQQACGTNRQRRRIQGKKETKKTKKKKGHDSPRGPYRATSAITMHACTLQRRRSGAGRTRAGSRVNGVEHKKNEGKRTSG